MINVQLTGAERQGRRAGEAGLGGRRTGAPDFSGSPEGFPEEVLPEQRPAGGRALILQGEVRARGESSMCKGPVAGWSRGAKEVKGQQG